MLHKAIWKGHPMRLELTREGLLVDLANHYTTRGAEPEWTWEQWQWRGALYSPRPKHYWDLTIRLFSVITRTLIGGVLSLYRGAVGVFYSLPSRLGKKTQKEYKYVESLSKRKRCTDLKIIIVRKIIEITQKFNSQNKIGLRLKIQMEKELKIGFVSLFNGISTSIGYLMPKPSFWRTVAVLFNPKLGR